MHPFLYHLNETKINFPDFILLAGLMIVRSCSGLKQFHFTSSILQFLFSLAAYWSSKIRNSIHFSECQLLACVPESKREFVHAFVLCTRS
jgi:hypothetical protein